MSSLPSDSGVARRSEVNDALADIRAGMVRYSGPGVRVRRWSNGTLVTPLRRDTVRPAAAAPATHPFQLLDLSDEDGLKVGVRFGMLNALTPAIGGTPINDSTPPTLTITASRYIVLRATVDSSTGLATAATILAEATVSANTSTTAHIALGWVAYTAASGGDPASITIDQSVQHSLQFQRCGPDDGADTIYNFWGV